MPGAIQDVITPANFCEDQLRGFGVAIRVCNHGTVFSITGSGIEKFPIPGLEINK